MLLSRVAVCVECVVDALLVVCNIQNCVYLTVCALCVIVLRCCLCHCVCVCVYMCVMCLCVRVGLLVCLCVCIYLDRRVCLSCCWPAISVFFLKWWQPCK